jgi:DNA-binding response OmpR family regulator
LNKHNRPNLFINQEPQLEDFLNNHTALIVEDDEFLSEIFSKALQSAEFDTEIVRDGQVALTRLDETRPDVVVLDLHLPHVSGKDILRYIRSAPHLLKTRVMVATADPLTADYLRDDANLVLIKPISFRQMRDLALRLRPKAALPELQL